MKLLADLHVHSCASADGRSSVQALIEAALGCVISGSVCKALRVVLKQ